MKQIRSRTLFTHDDVLECLRNEIVAFIDCVFSVEAYEALAVAPVESLSLRSCLFEGADTRYFGDKDISQFEQMDLSLVRLKHQGVRDRASIEVLRCVGADGVVNDILTVDSYKVVRLNGLRLDNIDITPLLARDGMVYLNLVDSSLSDAQERLLKQRFSAAMRSTPEVVW